MSLSPHYEQLRSHPPCRRSEGTAAVNAESVSAYSLPLTVHACKWLIDNCLEGIFWKSQANCPYELIERDYRANTYIFEDIGRAYDILRFAHYVDDENKAKEAKEGTRNNAGDHMICRSLGCSCRCSYTDEIIRS